MSVIFWWARRDCVAASVISFASLQAGKLSHFAAAPFPTEPASLGFGGVPFAMRVRIYTC